MMGNTVSIYIDDSSVRVMATRGRRIARLADFAMESGLSDIDSAEKETELAEKIRHLLKFNKIREKKIILGISGLRCLTRPIILPELPKAMLDEAVIREAKRLLPMPLEQLYLSWEVVSVSAGKITVFLVALQRQIADTVIRVINKAGYKPYLMDIKPLALARLSKEATAILLDVQPKEFDIVIMVNGIPQPIRTVAFPQESLTLADKFDIVKEDLKRTLEFVRSKTDENQVKPDTAILVSGELAEHPELHETLGTELGFKVAKLTSPLKYLKYLEPSQYLTNIGLALKQVTKEAGPSLPNFNTLPQPYQPMHISMNKLMAVPAALSAIGIIVLLVMSIQNAASNIEKTQNQLDSDNFLLEKRQTQKKEMMETVSNLEQQITGAETDYELYTSALKKIAEIGDNLNNDLTTSLNNFRSGISFNSLALNESVLSISGTAENEEEVFNYVRNLTSSGRFEVITINGISLAAPDPETLEESVSYSLTCVLKEGR